MVKKLKHDTYLKNLCEELKPVYDHVSTNIPIYSKRRRLVAEIDILAKRGDDCYIYEVKCSYRPHKARKQLRKIKKLIPNVKRMFFFCGESGSIEVIL